MTVAAMSVAGLAARGLRLGLRVALGERGRLTLRAAPGLLQRRLQLVDPLLLVDDEAVLAGDLTHQRLDTRLHRRQPRQQVLDIDTRHRHNRSLGSARHMATSPATAGGGSRYPSTCQSGKECSY